MTELETMQRAKMYIDKLSQGIDPITDRELPEDTVLNNVRLARCFFYISGILGNVIDQEGRVGKKTRKDFYITEQEYSRLRPLQENARITQLITHIAQAIDDPERKQLKTTVVTDWLMKKGFMTKETLPDGKTKRLPTSAGMQLGIMTQLQQGQHGAYEAVYYTPGAQQFVLDHLPEMLEKE